MLPILVDSSVWINYFNSADHPLVKTLEDYILRDESIFICPVIIQEVLQGIRNDAYFIEVKSHLLSLHILDLDPSEASVGAAELYRSLRKKGITINKSNDILIAHYAMFYNLPLLHNDNDFNLIAKHSSLKIYKP